MKIFIICSKSFYSLIPEIESVLRKNNHKITFPNTYPDTEEENKRRHLGPKEHSRWKASMINHSQDVVSQNDSVLVLNFTKNGIENYIGGATFLEMYEAFRQKKKIYLYNNIPEGMLKDEIIGFNPTIINGDLDKIL